jgi:hypothetical protein
LPLRPDPATARQIDAVHAHSNPARAHYQLAKPITDLPDELLALIGYDQVTDDAILGCPPIRALTNDWDDPLTSNGNQADI